MPFVVPGQQQPQQSSAGRGAVNRPEPVPQPQYQSRPQPQQQRQSDPWQQQRQQAYRQPQQQYQPQRRDPYGQRGGGRQYQQPVPQPQQRGRESYGRQPQPQYQPPMEYSNRPTQGNYVGEGVYADGTPMPSSGYNGQSLIQSNGGPAGGVYAGFSASPEVNGGTTPRAYLEEDDVYNKPMYTRRGGGGIY